MPGILCLNKQSSICPLGKKRITVTFSTTVMKSSILLFCVFPNFLIKLFSYTILLYKSRLGHPPFPPHYLGIPSKPNDLPFQGVSCMANNKASLLCSTLLLGQKSLYPLKPQDFRHPGNLSENGFYLLCLEGKMINLLFHGQVREALSLPAGSTLIKCGFYVNHNPDFLWIQNILAPLSLSDSKTRPWQMSFWAFADHSSTKHNSLILSLRAIYTNRSWLIETPALGTFPFFSLKSSLKGSQGNPH